MATQDIPNRQFSILFDVDEGEFARLTEASDEVRISAGELVFNTGQDIDGVYLVLEGRLASLFKRDWGEDRILDEMQAGELVGEAEFLDGNVCQLDIRALEESRILRLSSENFEQLLTRHRALRQSVTESARAKTCRLLVAKYLSNLFSIGKMEFSDPMLQLQAEQDWLDFERDILQHLEERSEWVQLRRGEYLFRQGDRSDYAYVLASGTVGVYISENGTEEYELRRVAQGEIFGELALLYDCERTASILAVRDCELFRLNSRIFSRLSEEYPRIMLNVYKTITARYQNVHGESEGHRSKRPAIAVLPASGDLELGDLCSDLIREISLHGSVAGLTSHSVGESLGKAGIANSSENDPANLRLARWLNAHESRLDHVVYQADQGWTNWTHRCVRQADHVVVVADAGNAPRPPEIQSRLDQKWHHWSLVLLHPEHTDRPRNTARWLEGSSAEFVYHVRRGNRRDLARLARILSGRAVSLVLSGGGARGAAHIGVLRALEELGVDVDMVGGVSIGAMIAVYVAQDMDAGHCLAAARRSTKDSLLDFTLPLTSVISGKRFVDTIGKDTGSWDIEDYWIPFFCVSTNLVTGQQVIHRRGNSARAVRASISIPGLMPPVTGDDELLVDGGVLDNLPIRIMRDSNPDGLIVAINVSIPKALSGSYDYGQSLSGWKQLLLRLNPFRRDTRAPSLAEIVVQSMLVGSNLARQQVPPQQLADFYKMINVEGVQLFEFSALDHAENTGYEQTKAPLKAWVEAVFSKRDRPTS